MLNKIDYNLALLVIYLFIVYITMTNPHNSYLMLIKDYSINYLLARSLMKKVTALSICMLVVSMVFISLNFAISGGFLSLNSEVYTQKELQQNDNPVSDNKIKIDLNSATFSQTSDKNHNQLRILINYQTLDPALMNTPMAGTMKFYDINGLSIKTSPIPKGDVVGGSGVM